MRIAYLAPELPGLSSTFVYKEIFALEKLGIDVLPFTIHANIQNPNTEALRTLKNRTSQLYSRNFLQLAIDNIFMFGKKPKNYLHASFLLAKDFLNQINKPRIAVGLLYRFLIGGSLARELLKNKVNHIHAHFAHFPTDIAMYAGIQSGIPFSFTAHANDIFSNYWLLKEKTFRAKFTALISQYNINYLNQLGCCSDRMHIVRCGVDTTDYPLISSKTPSTKLRLGFLGRLVEKKGADTLLRACHELKSRGESFELGILGDGPLLNELQALSNSLNLSEHVQFKGKVDNSHVFPWLNTIDVFILPAQKDGNGDMDGIPVALMEAMLCNTAVISSRLSGIPELVIHQETGLLAIPSDHIDLANCICILSHDKELREKIICNARTLVEREFNTSNSAEILSRLFKSDCRNPISPP